MKSLDKSVLSLAVIGSFMTGAAFAKVAPNTEACTVKESRTAAKEMMADYHRVDVFVYYESPDGGIGQPAAGVHIFDARTNRLLGQTRDDGRLQLQVASGTVLRAVEPVYGEQQYVGEPIYNDKGEIIGWKAPK